MDANRTRELRRLFRPRRHRQAPQQASSISSARGTLGKYRHLLMIVQPTTGIDDDGTQQNFGTFFGEIDVYAGP